MSSVKAVVYIKSNFELGRNTPPCGQSRIFRPLILLVWQTTHVTFGSHDPDEGEHSECSPNFFRRKEMSKERRQIAGQPWTFVRRKTKEADSGVLPSQYGQSNEFAAWYNDYRWKSGGAWVSRKFKNASNSEGACGLGPQGLIIRMRRLRRRTNFDAERYGFTPILTTAEEMVKQWESQNGICIACNKPGVTLLGHGSAYDHNHETGEGRGFLHNSCNSAEGQLKDLSDESFLHFMKWMRPHLFNKEQ
jgi:recombination endonuclease VII